MKIRPKPDEGRQQYYQRSSGIINRLFVKTRAIPIYIRIPRQLHTWIYTWWTFQQDDGKQPFKDYMNVRPAADWETARDIMQELDCNNKARWRHQFSGKLQKFVSRQI